MNKLLTIIFLFFSCALFATNRYFSNAGNDVTGNGTIGFPYATIQKLNTLFGSFTTGDSILFRRGDTFYGGIVNNKAGMNFGAYGTGNKPIITGLSTVTGWVNTGGNLWEAPVTNVASAVNLVLRNGIPQQIGRFPNANAANGGYLTFTTATLTSLTGSANSSTTNWTGAEVAVKVRHWDITRRIVLSHSGGTITFTDIGQIPTPGFGYFFQRDPKTLDIDGEWWYNSATSKLRVYSTTNPSTHVYQISTVATTFLSTFPTTSVTNLFFIGSDQMAVRQTGGSIIKVQDCDFNLNGGEAIDVKSATTVLVNRNNINNSLGSGIRVSNPPSLKTDVALRLFTVTNNTVDSTCLIAGMEISDGVNGGSGILCNGGDSIIVINNSITNSGYNGMEWKGSAAYIRNNFIDRYCIVRDDGGGIYTVESIDSASAATAGRFRRYINSNIVINGTYNNTGTTGTIESNTNGIYLDLGTRNIVGDSNTVAYIAGNGLHGNNDSNITLRHNTFFNCIYHLSFQRFPHSSIHRHSTVTSNILYPYRYKYRNQSINKPTLLTREADMLAMGTFNNNYYSTKTGVDTSVYTLTIWESGANPFEEYRNFAFLTGTVGMETGSISVVNTGTLEYNASYTPKTVTFPGLSKKDVYGNVYNNSVTIPAWSSKVLIPNGTTTGNALPVANAGADKAITLPTNSVTLVGTGTDTDGTITGYLWVKVSGPTGGTIASPTSATTVINSLQAGTYVYSLQVTDNSGGTDNDEVQILVNAANIPPTANAGPNQSITLPTNSATLAGSGSDADGNITGYAWVQLSGPNTSTINPTSSVSTGTTNVSGLIAGVYTYRLTVTDDDGLQNSATTTVTVNPAANIPPTANAGVDQSVTLPTSTTTLIGSGNDPDGSIVSYAWIKISGPSGGNITSPSSATTGITALQQGTYVFQLTVTDNGGLPASDLVQVVVNAANIAPTANAGPDQSITLPTSTATLSGSGTDPDGSITAYLWTKISGPAGGNITSPTSATTGVTSLQQGTYVFSLKVTDNNGSTGTDFMQIVVNAANVAPTANAGIDQSITLPTNSTTLNGSGTDPDGSIVSYAWVKISGPVGGVIASPNSASTGITSLSTGTYVYRLTVTDNGGLTGQDFMQIVVSPANIAPTANAGVDQSITLPTNTATLSGSGTDPDGVIVGYAWVKISGPAGGNITSPSSASTGVTALQQGTYVYRLTVTDNGGLTGQDFMQIVVSPAPIAPTANAGIDQSITLPVNTATLSGSGTDPDGVIVGYAWVKISGPAGGTITSPSSASTGVTALQQGTYVYQLTVTDDDNLTGQDFMQIVVNPAIPPANIPPVAVAGADQTLTLPTNSTTVNGSGSSDPDGTITGYLWTKISGPAGGTITSATSAITGITSLAQGVYTYQLRVTDNNGDTATDAMQIRVFPANIAPTANAGADQVITLPTNTTTLVGSGTDPDGTIAGYLWTKISGPSGGAITSSTSSTTGITSLAQGVYIYQLRVTDNVGDTATDAVQITVNAANLAPTVNAGANQTITLPTSTTTLVGSATDPDGTIVAYLWTKIAGPTGGAITSPTSSTTGITGLGQGVYIYQLRATDNSGDTATDAIQITVNAANLAPVVNAGANQTITLPTSTTTLVGTATDADGTITGYLWRKIAGPSGGAITSATSATTGITGLVAGVYTYQLRATDNSGDTATDAMQITVNAANIGPTANAGANQSITLPTNSTTLTGSGTDQDGTITGYLWTKISGPSGGAITSSTSATTGITGLIQGVYTYQLRVTDNSGDTATDAVQISVNPVYVPPTATAGSDIIITLPVNTTTITGSGTNGTNVIVSHVWRNLSGPNVAVIATPNLYTTGVSNLIPGTYLFLLTVTDSNGITGTDILQVIVNPAPPTRILLRGYKFY